MANRRDNWTGSKWIRPEKRLAIYLRDGMACAYCGVSVEDGGQMSLDHLKPASNGGSNEASNLVTCCRRCNSARQDRPVASFAAGVADYLGVDVVDITGHIRNCRRRQPKLVEAKRLIARRGSAAKVLAEMAG